MVPSIGDFKSFKFFKNSLETRSALAWILRYNKAGQNTEIIDDESVYDFIDKHIYALNEEDRDFIMNVHNDANLRSIFGGDIHKLSARSCTYTSDKFNAAYKKEYIGAMHSHAPEKAETLMLMESMRLIGKTVFRFDGGMKGFSDHLTDYLQNQGVKFIDEDVTKIDHVSPRVTFSDGCTRDFRHIISTVNSKVLGTIYPPLAFEIPHNTWTTVNLAYDQKPPMDNMGYMVPSGENQNMFTTVYNYNLFPDTPPSITLYGQGDGEVLIKEFRRHTGFVEEPQFFCSSILVDAVPQFHVGHYLKQLNMENSRPKWMHVAGISFYQTGISGCVQRSLGIIERIFEEDDGVEDSELIKR